jgi:hypothetical protein
MPDLPRLTAPNSPPLLGMDRQELAALRVRRVSRAIAPSRLWRRCTGNWGALGFYGLGWFPSKSLMRRS